MNREMVRWFGWSTRGSTRGAFDPNSVPRPWNFEEDKEGTCGGEVKVHLLVSDPTRPIKFYFF